MLVSVFVPICSNTLPRRSRGRTVTPVYEWLPTSIVVGTFLLGLVSESVEAGRFRTLTDRLR